ncbi:Zn-ribbon domain-containing OB-fold protein [Caballeronia sp. DA-9]|jgi:uncharacterized OB-fold protein|uniref:Zn-ribbon domain-containing OB-fold protein n=1 Tax=Caballeronia sp. DA-9 TaxID=3436237 RepID=UPI003F66444B
MSQATSEAARTPQPVMGLYDRPMWESIREHAMKLQCCTGCGGYQYPPAPVCVHCLSTELEWRALSGQGSIISWVVFHKSYLDAYPAPYNVIAVRLAEGPVMISNLESPLPEGSWIGKPVRMTYVTMADELVLPRFVIDSQEQKSA